MHQNVTFFSIYLLGIPSCHKAKKEGEKESVHCDPACASICVSRWTHQDLRQLYDGAMRRAKAGGIGLDLR